MKSDREQGAAGVFPAEYQPYIDQIPALADHKWEKASEAEPQYNCIAWAVGKNDKIWWPPAELSSQTYWPAHVPALETLEAFCQAFESEGFCRGPTDRNPAEVERVAIYCSNTTGAPTHAARQLEDGTWASKLGVGIDIVHEQLGAVEGDRHFSYGEVKAMLWRERP